MPKVSNVNVAVTTMAEGWWLLRTTLLAAGWTVQGSSDGTTWANAGQTAGPFDVLSSSGAGAGGFNNANAWMRLQDPDGLREILIRMVNASNTYIWYSKAGRFSSGGSATVKPVASDQRIVKGYASEGQAAGADQYSEYPTMPVRMHCIAFDDPTPEGVYTFFLFATPASGSGAGSYGLYCDGLYGDDRNSGDDPCIFFTDYGTATAGGTNYFLNTNRMWVYSGEADELWTEVGVAVVRQGGSGGTFPGGCSPDPFDGSDPIAVPVVYRYRGMTNERPGFMGKLRKLRFPGVARNYGNTLDLATNCYAYIAGVLLVPYEDGTPPSTA